MISTLHSPADELLNPDTIVAICDEDGPLRAEMPPLPRCRTADAHQFNVEGAYRLPTEGFEPPLPLPASPVTGARAESGETVRGPSSGGAAHAPVRFKIRLANAEGQRRSASYLIEKMYGWRGYEVGDSCSAGHPSRVTLVASDAQHALATITVGFDSIAGMAVDDLYPAEVERLRAAGARLCEFTKLAVDREPQSKELLAMMFHIAYMYAHRIHGCSDLLIEVNPRHVRFYQRMLDFDVLGEERTCARVNAPARLLWLPLAHAREQIARYGGHKECAAEIRSLYPFFFSADEETGIVGRLRAIG